MAVPKRKKSTSKKKLNKLTHQNFLSAKKKYIYCSFCINSTSNCFFKTYTKKHPFCITF